MRFPGKHFFATLVGAFQGTERIAGLVVERERIRFAEFRRAGGRRKGRVLIEEGAALLPKESIHDGTLMRPDLLTEAVKTLRQKGTPKSLSASTVILSLPLAHVVGRTIAVPATVRADEVEGLVRLELERTLPFPVSESYLDWQELPSEGGSRMFLIVAVRRSDVDPYVDAVQAGGIAVAAVEPITLSIARGLEGRSGISYIVLLHRDAMLAVATDASGNVRMFHHRSIPALGDVPLSGRESSERAKAIGGEISSFIRFFRSENGGAEQEIIVDGILDEPTVERVRSVAEQAGIPLRMEQEAHGLSRAAARGTALRAMLPRREDRLISLMAEGTEAAYARQQRLFFVSAAYRIATVSTALTLLLLLGALGMLAVLERSAESEANRISVPAEVAQARADVEALNAAIGEAVVVLPTREIPPALFPELARLADADVHMERVTAHVEGDRIAVEFAVVAETTAALRRVQEALTARFTTDAITIPPQIFLDRKPPITYLFSFMLRPDFGAPSSP